MLELRRTYHSSQLVNPFPMRKRPQSTTKSDPRPAHICSAALIALGAVAGCSLDDRTLHPIPSTSAVGSGGSGGSASGAGGGASDTSESDGAGGTNPRTATSSGGSEAAASSVGSTTSSTTSSVSGTGPGIGIGIGISNSNSATSASATTGEGGAGNDAACPDLDENGVADCDETLVSNATFDSNLNDWHEEPNALGHWSDDDALDHAASGSANITNRGYLEHSEGQITRGLWQCIPASGGAKYRLLAQVRILDEQGQGGVNVEFYDGAQCTGNAVSASTPLLGTTSDWQLTQTQAEAPANARTMLVRLVVNKPFNGPESTVDFDNVLIRED